MSRATEKQWCWRTGADTGSSSIAIFDHMIGVMPRRVLCDYPLDPSDFGRCYRLLMRFPAWRRRIVEMREHGEIWTAYTAQWVEMEALWEQEQANKSGRAPLLYAMMCKLQGRGVR